MASLVQELEGLVQETRDFLAFPDPDTEVWMGYGMRRKKIFARLRAVDFEAISEEREIVCALIKEVQDLTQRVEERAQRHLIDLRGEISLLANKRRVLKGYASRRPAALVEYSV